MTNTRVKISSIVQSQLPDFVREEYPLVSEFLKEYYNSLEGKGGTLDVLQNIDKYLKIDELTQSLFNRTVTVRPTSPQTYFNISGGFSTSGLIVYKNGKKLTKNVDYFIIQTTAVNLTSQAINGDVLEFVIQSPSSTFLKSSLDLISDTIDVESTYGFPESNGVIKIDSEIIFYQSKTSTSFTNCTRGFSGITSYRSLNRPDQLEFSETQASSHSNNAKVENLSSLLLKEFLLKIKKQLVPGFENRELAEGLNQNIFIKQVKDFYKSKGTDDSYKLLFKSLFGESVDVLKPRDFLLKPSNANYKVTRDLVVEALSGDPESLLNRTLYQDEDLFFQKAYGTVTKVEKIQRSDKEYYVISLDSDYNKDITVTGTVYGNFSVHASTKSTSKTSVNSQTIDVDSTIGFPVSSSTLTYTVNGIEYTSRYRSTNVTQFLLIDKTSIEIPKGTDIKLDKYAYSNINGNAVKVRITGVISDVSYDQDNFLMSENDPIKAVTLGYSNEKNQLSNGWIFNISNRFNLKQIKGPNSTNTALNLFSYELITYDPHTFYVGDIANLIYSDGTTTQYKVVRINNDYSISVEGPKINNLNLRFSVERDIVKPKFSNIPSLNQYAANVQNVYIRNENDIYIAANSLPNYLNENIDTKNTDIVFSGVFSGDTFDLSSGNPSNYHGLYTGDSIFYNVGVFDITNSLGILSKTYYVKKVDDTKIKLSNSKSDLFNERYVSLSGISTVSNNVFKKTKIQSIEISPQTYIKNITTPVSPDEEDNLETPVGPIGIFVNGVEAFSYKSEDKVYYGGIEKVDVIDGGEDYDVIAPPSISILDGYGSNAIAHAHVTGSLERIDVIDGGFDYIETPIINITDGNGLGATAKANLTNVRHRVPFNSIESAGLVDLVNDKIGFSTYHKFRDFEKVLYLPEGQTSVGGLSTNAQYYVAVQDEYNVKLHKNLDDAISGINTINLTSYGVGVHLFESFSPKRIISSITVLSGGENYSNRKTLCNPTGINTASNIINITNHGYSSGEIIKYTSTGSPIGGLVDGDQYYVVKINDDQIKLTSVGIATTNKDFYYRTNQIINLTSIGSSSHIFNYPDITVSVSGKIGVSTITGQNFNAKFQPVFRGSIDSIFIENPGVGYGSSEIINYERQPKVVLGIGSEAQLSPIVNDGKIKQVLVLNGGSNYTSPPTISVIGVGTAAILTPIIRDGKISEVKVISGGVGFNTVGTFLDVVPSGRGFIPYSRIRSWSINKVEKNIISNQIQDDDGILDTSSYTRVGLQYCHTYAPRKLRRSVFGIDYVNGEKVFVPDLSINANREVTSSVHSPIIGWAYDGNPIYGPYGYSSPSGGNVREMISGYISQVSPDRPDPTVLGQKIYPEGFFIEDYQFNNSGDLDEHNGRFCVTPEFPSGVYAYFATINNGSTDTSGIFKNYKKPTFPYLIGNTFKSAPNQINYSRDLTDQTSFAFASNNLLRNTTPYNLTRKNSQYDFIYNPLKIREPNIKVKSISLSGLDYVGIITGGSGYKIGDKVVFNNTNTTGSDAYAEVSYLKGKKINSISFASTSIEGVEFYPSNSTGKFIGFSSFPNNLLNNDIILISGLSTSLTTLNQFFKVGVRSDTLSLSEPVGNSTATGIITYFNVNGSLDFPNVRENDVYQIENEKVKVLSIDKPSSRIKVLRSYESTAGSAHTISTVLYERTRKFTFELGRNDKNIYNLNREIYFNPLESVSLGTSEGIGVGNTLYFSNPGVGITNIFVPTKTIYLPEHKLETGTELKYSSNGGTALFVSDDGVSSFQLVDDQSVYVAKVSDNLIGISTNKVGLGSTGSFVGIDSSVLTSTLYFTNYGSGQNHSFKTNYSNVLTGEVSKNVVTVSTASTHGLNQNDLVYLDVLPGISTNIVIKYNDKNKRLVVNPKSFTLSDVDIVNNIITIENHEYATGDKVIYNSTVPIGGLNDDEIYYVIRFNKNKIKLSSSYYNAVKDIPEVIDLNSASFGTLSQVNPRISIISNQIINFDLSDSSLSYTKGPLSYSSFEFKLFENSDFTNEFNKSEDSTKFDVVQTGRIGIDSSCYVTLNTENLNSDLYYSLVPVDLNDNFVSKKEIIIDNENINDNNKLLLSQSSYYGFHNIVGVSQTSFTFNILSYPEKTSYLEADGNFQYYTDSKNTSGEIKEVEVISPGRYYDTSPGITSIFSANGRGSILDPITYSIGKVRSIEVQDIGFDYPVDTTLSPTSKLPTILKVNPLSIFKSVGVSSVGINYTLSPDLVVIDSYTNQVVEDVDLRYDIDKKSVEIIRNTDGLYNTSPIILPVNNSNGVSINNITFNSVTKNVTVELGVNYSFGDIFPFNIGDKVLIENVSVGTATTVKGFNSKNYNYSLFTLTSVNPQYGGSGATLVYNLTDYLLPTEFPGVFDSENSAGIVVPQKYFPIFDSVLEKYKFSKGEVVNSESYSGEVIYWNKDTEELKISTADNFEVDNLIVGESSKAKGTIVRVDEFDSVYNIAASSIVKKGWSDESGFLNNQFQVIPNNDYYQNFSYSIKSKVDYETWNESIGNINHTAGFKKFSDLIVESTDVTFTGISTTQDSGAFTGIAEFVQEIDLNCINNFDLAREKTLNIDSEYYSKEIILNSVSLQDEFVSIGNRVLSIDDISEQFSNVPGQNNYSNVDTFALSEFRSKKYITYVRDKRFTGLRQIYLVSVLHDGLEGYITQYARTETDTDLGSFDFSIFGTEGTLEFYPVKYFYNNYDISVLSYGIKDITTGTGSTSLGNLIDITSSTTTIPSGTSVQTNIVGIASTYRASKVLVQFSSTNGTYFEFEELTLLNDGTDINIMNYGRLTNSSRIPYVGDSLGTYSAYISGSTINLDFTPNVGLGTTYVVNTLRVSFSEENSSITTDSLLYNTSEVKSEYVSISSSPSPTATGISTYSLDYGGSYYVTLIEDTTNNEYQVSEIVVVDDETNAYINEFGVIESSSGLGTFGVGVSTITGTTLNFTPNPNIAVNVKVYSNSMRVVDTGNVFDSYGFTNANIDSSYSGFEGIYNSIRRSFDLNHKQIPIFQRVFDASDSTIVNVSDDSIRIPRHFYVTGEELVYSPGNGEPIGIAATNIVGIGITSKMPSSVFVIKVNDLSIKLASTAENALKSIPEPLNITSVGIGTTHTFTSKKQNTKCLVTIDNYIQSPIVSTSTTTVLTRASSFNEVEMKFLGISSIFGGDLLQINNEIVKVNTVGFGSTNVFLVDRGWMGTNPDNHSIGSTVTKILGNYNIIDNTIHFVEAPYGNSPIGTITNRPDDRDYTGITTRSTFDGRVFLRSGLENGTEEPYDKNYIFDGLSEQFTGITTEFTLTSSKSNVTGISTGSAIILINNIFQEPQRLGNVDILGNYKLTENIGITTIGFIGNISSTSYDINTASIPRGGVVISVASTPGFGYQPLISAGGTCTVSVAGTISNISIGYSGSGYRSLRTYEILTETSSIISSGSTIIPINNQNGVLNKLQYSSSNTIGIGSIFQNVSIVGFGNTYVVIGTGNTSSESIDAGSTVLITLESPTVGLVDVGVKTESTGIVNYEFIGFTTISSGHISTSVTITNPGSGYTSTSTPVVVFDAPSNYDNIPLVYSSGYSGIGTQATIDIVVGQGSSIIDFQIKNTGYAYKTSEVLTIPTDGLFGIPTDPTKTLRDFELTVDQVFSDLFSGWSVGDFQVIDKIENLFNGTRRTFPIKIEGTQTSIRARVGSNIDVQSVLLIFLNDILQVPGSSYTFNGGSIITFSEPPKEGDTCKIIFYKGTGPIDVTFTDVLETIKIGDTVQLDSDLLQLKEDSRLVTDIIASDIIQTNPYNGFGLTQDETLNRPLNWCRQTEDKIISGKEVGKDRELYEPLIYPTSYIINSVGIGQTIIYVDNLRPMFDSFNENNGPLTFQKKITILSQDSKVSASATATVSSAGTITSINIVDGGFGYTSSPSISIENPVGIATTTSSAVASITSGVVTSITLTGSVAGYSSTNPPQILIEPPTIQDEENNVFSYTGDSGVIVGYGTTAIGSSNYTILDLFIPIESEMRNSSLVGTAVTISSLETGDYFIVNNSNVGFGTSSLRSIGISGATIGITTQFLDTVYQVSFEQNVLTNVIGVGVTYVKRVLARISSGIGTVNFSSDLITFDSTSYTFDTVVGLITSYSGQITTSNYFGNYSWGKVIVESRTKNIEFNYYGNNGTVGVTTSAMVKRFAPLRYTNYIVV